MNFDKRHPYYRKLWWRTKLPWFFIERGFAAKGEDCEHVNADHHLYNINNTHSGCYYCKVVKEVEQWRK